MFWFVRVVVVAALAEIARRIGKRIGARVDERWLGAGEPPPAR